MKPTIRVTSRLPAVWNVPEAVAQANIRVNDGRLRAKLLVFKNPTQLRKYWLRMSGQNLGRGCLGAVNALAYPSITFPGGRETIKVDARFFCVIGLVKDHLTMRIITHESVHAGFCFAKRNARSWWDAQASEFDEEPIAYPAGEIGREIVIALTRLKLLP